MIELSDVTLTYPDGDSRITAVDRVSLTVRPGTVVGITGPSGSGKSSLLAIASTLISADSGRVVVAGEDATQLSLTGRARLRRERLGIVFQQSNLLASLTATDQLVLMGEIAGRRRDSAGRIAVTKKAAGLLAAVGLSEHAHKRPAQLSGGQRQRVNIARALMNDPVGLVVDEPTSALDRERGSQILDLILRLTDQHHTATILVTHDTRLLPRLSEVFTMVDGALKPGFDPGTAEG